MIFHEQDIRQLVTLINLTGLIIVIFTIHTIKYKLPNLIYSSVPNRCVGQNKCAGQIPIQMQENKRVRVLFPQKQ